MFLICTKPPFYLSLISPIIVQAEPTQWDQLTQTEIALAHFTASLPNFFIPNTSFVNPELVVVHTLAQVSVIQLHHPFAQKEVASHAKCLQAAKAVAQIATCIGASEYQFLDPIIGVSPFYSINNVSCVNTVLADMLDVCFGCFHQGEYVE